MAELKLDAEMKEKLKGLMPFSQEGVIEFTPPEYLKLELPGEFVPVFTHRCFSQSENQKLLDATLNANTSENMIVLREYGRKVTKGWKNLIDLATETLIEYKSDADGGCDKTLWDEAILNGTAAAIARNAGYWSGALVEEKQALKS